jgi:hypothetical protein
LNQIKQLLIALQNHHDTRKALPLASTAPFRQGTNNKIQYGMEGMQDPANPSPTTPLKWYAGQNGDGYSWVVQILPFMEENVLYDKLIQQVGTGNPPTRRGKLQDAAFPALGTSSPTQNPGTAPNVTTNPLIYATKLAVMVCPSFPGEEEVPVFGQIKANPHKVGTGNYVAVPSTHYQSGGDLESGAPTGNNATTGRSCAQGAYCGNGALPFPGLVGNQVQKLGLGFQSLSDGTSKVVLVSESREETATSWYSGFASYVVGAWPGAGANNQPRGVQASNTSPVYWGCPSSVPQCDHALNKGDTKGVKERFYQATTTVPNPHGTGVTADRIWGPSSRHPGVVQHGYADAHAEGVSETIDKDVYLHLITRNGREVDNVTP